MFQRTCRAVDSFMKTKPTSTAIRNEAASNSGSSAQKAKKETRTRNKDRQPAPYPSLEEDVLDARYTDEVPIRYGVNKARK